MPNIQEAMSAYTTSSAPVLGKWSGRLNEVNKILKEESRPQMKLEAQIALAKVLENTQKRMNYELREATQNTMVGPYKKYALDVISGMVPNLIALDLVNVQPIENKMGIINYVKFSSGALKGNQPANGTIATTFNYTGSDKNYTAQQVDTQMLTYVADAGAKTVTFVLPWKPVVPNTLVLTLDATTDVVVTEEGGVLVSTAGDFASGTINYATGVVVLTFTTNVPTGLTAATGAWYFNNEYAPVDVPEINLSIESIPVLARSRKLKALWAFDAAFELQKEYGQDLNGLLAAQAAAEIAHEIDMEVLQDLYTGAYTSVSQPAISWSAIAPYGVSQAQHFETLKTAFNVASNRIFQNTKRAIGNFVVVGTNVATVLESVPSFKPADLGSNIGPYYLGTWGGFKVYKNPFYDPNAFLVGYKGNSLFEAGYCYAPYYPVATTQMLMLADFQGQQGWATSYGKTFLNNYMYVPGTISGM